MQLGLPDATGKELSEYFVLYDHGNSDKTTQDCSYFKMEPKEYVREMTLSYSTSNGLDQVNLVSSNGQ